ncbi:MAG: hypothetical protein ACLTSX_04200 [Collinsella sp.]
MDYGSTHISRLRRAMLWSRAWMSALPTDGDADRCLAVDERGNLVDGDLILYVWHLPA